MFFCPTCGADRWHVPPVQPCPACGTRSDGAPADAARSEAAAKPKERPPLSISPPIAVLAVLVIGGYVAVKVWASSTPDGDIRPPWGPDVVLDKFKTLEDGERITWKLPAGTYSVEVTATGDGASVRWAGADCKEVHEVQAYATTCILTKTAQMSVENSTAFGLGASITATVKATRLR